MQNSDNDQPRNRSSDADPALLSGIPYVEGACSRVQMVW